MTTPHVPNTITDIRDGLATNLKAIEGLRVERFWPELVNPPTAIIAGPEILFNADTMSDNYSFPILVFTGEINDEAAQTLLDEYCAPSSSRSVRAALEHETTLGGAAEYITVTTVLRYGIHDLQTMRAWGAEFTARVVALR